MKNPILKLSKLFTFHLHGGGTLFIIIAVALINLGLWAIFNRPEVIVPWSGIINGVSFSPYGADQNPLNGDRPDPSIVSGDLKLLSGKVARVRTYTSTDGVEEVPRLAAQYGLRVTAGAWVDHRLDHNEKEIQNLVRNVRTYPNIERVIVGNESVLRHDLGKDNGLTVDQLIRYLRRVRRLTDVPVSTAEPWHVWIKHPELVAEVDYIAIHVLPYWEKIPADVAVKWVEEQLHRLQAMYPGKHVMFGEVGWPSGGEHRGTAEASLVNEARFVREFLNLATREKLDYFIMEAFDQPWKREIEGYVGRYWGLFDAHRQPKFAFTGTVEDNPLWKLQALLALCLALLPIAWFVARFRHIQSQGRLFYALIIQGCASLLVWTASAPFLWYLVGWETFMWAIMLPAQIALLIVVLINGFEMSEMLFGRLHRIFKPLEPSRDHPLPKVSLHLAICNEPPAMVIETLNSLARLDYPDYEILVIDNNTTNELIWQPVKAHCELLGPRFRFFTLGKIKGYKAGALNFALTVTDPAAVVVGLIDSDYVVEPNWLRATLPYFDNSKIGFVQAPQDHRDGPNSPFKTMINWEYTGFFKIGMVQRNERNAIIQHGTMTLIRKSALIEVGSWSEWCICEDSELGLRLFEAGYESVYLEHTFGKGLSPDSFAGYKRQRYRWAYGAMQILKGHWRNLLPGHGPLSAGQKFHFVTGWIPWFADALHLLFSVAALIWSLALLTIPHKASFPLTVFLLPTIALFGFKLLHSFWLYAARVPCGWGERIGASIAGMSLTHAIAHAVITGLLTKTLPFHRTPKMENQAALLQGLMMAREESLMLIALCTAAIAVLTLYGTDVHEALLWAGVLAVQAVPYLAALITATASAIPGWGFLRRGSNAPTLVPSGQEA
ncbi:Cellulose synthase [Gammaproteobacteria bacterium]